jgi:hypothetical protein
MTQVAEYEFGIFTYTNLFVEPQVVFLYDRTTKKTIACGDREVKRKEGEKEPKHLVMSTEQLSRQGMDGFPAITLNENHITDTYIRRPGMTHERGKAVFFNPVVGIDEYNIFAPGKTESMVSCCTHSPILLMNNCDEPVA